MMEKTTAPPSAPKRVETVPPSADTAERIRKIIASIPPANDYPAELDRIVEIGSQGVPVLIPIFEDASAPWQSRWIAGMALGRLSTAAACRALERGISDPLFLVRMASIQALSRSGDRSAGPLLRKALSDPALVVRSAAVESLERIRDRQAVPDLIRELSAPRNFHRGRSLWIREQIIGALGTIGEEGAIRPLLTVLRESEMGLRLCACSALARIDPAAPPASLPASDPSCVEGWTKWGVSRSGVPGPK
jgi:HEAT repeat protein